MIGNIQNPDYETVTAECDHCGSVCVFNRIDDIGDPGPYAGCSVTCLNCKKQFRIWGDTINPLYELLYYSARERLSTKRYMQCVTMLAQAWEVFFSAYAYSNYLYRPCAADPTCDESSKRFENLSSRLYQVTQKHTFFPLRNVLVNTVLKDVHPQTLPDSEAAISRIDHENFGNDPSKADIENFTDQAKRDLLRQLNQLKIGKLRNDVVHQHAYRPSRSEVEQCFEEIGILYNAKLSLPVHDLESWRDEQRRLRRV